MGFRATARSARSGEALAPRPDTPVCGLLGFAALE